MANIWTPETGFHSKELKHNKYGYPRAALGDFIDDWCNLVLVLVSVLFSIIFDGYIGSGKHLGLTLILNAATHEYYCSSTSGYGFKVLIHSPQELPEINNYGLGIANGYESRIVVTPIISQATERVRQMPLKIRRCLYENENFLKLYR